MENLEFALVANLARELGYKNVDEYPGYIEIYGGFKNPERFISLEECKNFLFNEKRIHESRVKENRESYMRLCQRRNQKVSRLSR